MRRRDFLTLAALAAPALILPRMASAAPRRALMHPELNTGRLEAGTRVFDLKVAVGETAFLPGKMTRTLGVNRSFLGDFIAAKDGEHVRINVENAIDESMTLHWHGLRLPAAMDGGPHQMVQPGQTWSPEFTLDQGAGTYWYHGHRMGKTAEHVWAGMAGILRIDGDGPEGLPSRHGEDDFTLVLQDRSFDGDGQMPYAPSMHSQMAGMSGDVPLVNGTPDATLDLPRGTIRLRFLNGSNASFYDLGFSDGRSFTQVASDGGYLPAPALLTRLLLAPGERAEIVLDLTDDKPVSLQAEAFGAEVAMMGGFGIFDFLELNPVLADRGLWTPPARLTDLAAPVPEASTKRRDMVLEMGGGMGRMMMGGGFTINGARMAIDRIDFTVPVDTTETWVVQNTTPMIHPFHVHDTQFRILSRNGAAPAPGEAGWKDTVVTHPGEEVEIQASFTKHTDPDLPYMYHCHILEHEDAGMMGQFTVV